MHQRTPERVEATRRGASRRPSPPRRTRGRVRGLAAGPAASWLRSSPQTRNTARPTSGASPSDWPAPGRAPENSFLKRFVGPEARFSEPSKPSFSTEYYRKEMFREMICEQVLTATALQSESRWRVQRLSLFVLICF